jgi:hypothetical protein
MPVNEATTGHARAWTIATASAVILIALCLQVVAINQQSFSGDAVFHLLAGHQALRYGSNTVNLEHPPLAKMIFALPAVLDSEALAPPLAPDRGLAAIYEVHQTPEKLFRAARRGRWMALLVFVLPLWAAAFALGRRYGGKTTGVALLGFTALPFMVVGNAAILQTDTAVTLAFVLTILSALRLSDRATLGRAVVLGLAFGFGLTVKHSAVLLAPVVLLTTLVRSGVGWRRRLTLATITMVSALLVVETAYRAANAGAEYEAMAATVEATCHGQATLLVGDQMRGFAPSLMAVAKADPYLAQWLTGLLGIAVQDSIGVYPCYVLGEVSYTGRWWYFPLVLMAKLPLVIIAAAIAAVVAWFRARPGWHRGGILHPAVIAVVVYLAAAMTSSYNIGVRHLLPILPLLLLPVAGFVARHRPLCLAIIAVLALESVCIAPSWMCSTNTWWLGTRNPTRFAFGAGDTEYWQGFFRLAEELERRGVTEPRVLFPTFDERVLKAYLPASRLVRQDDTIDPGWYVVNVTVEQYLPALAEVSGPGIADVAQSWQPVWQAICSGEDHGYIADTFHLYRIGEP